MMARFGGIYCLFILFFVLSAAGCGGRVSDSGNEALLQQLDRAVEERHTWDEKFNRQLDRLKSRLDGSTPRERVDICYELCNLYRFHNMDSALHYVSLIRHAAMKSASRRSMQQAHLMAAMIYQAVGRSHESYDELQSTDTLLLSAAEMVDYLSTERSLLRLRMQRSENDSLRAACSARMAECGRRRLELVDPDGAEHGWYVGLDKRAAGDVAGAIEYLSRAFDAAEDAHLRARIAVDLAACYRSTGDMARYEHMLAVSALNDLKASVKEYTSLPQLAILLFEQGDVGRANRYMRCTMEDVLACNHNSRVVQFSAANEAISAAYAGVLASRRRIAMAMIVAVCIFAIAIALALRLALLQKRRVQTMNAELSDANSQLVARNGELSDLNRQLSEMNYRLTDANHIKEQYVGHYMDLCSSYIGKLDEYRHQLNRTVTAGGLEAVKRELLSPDVAERERRDFYRMFDATFLDIFPDFVGQVNALLAEPSRFKPRAARTLNTELRILAVIRLGITDSVKIAYFLNCSLSTIYNYRTKMRNAALGDRDDFEAAVQRIAAE